MIRRRLVARSILAASIAALAVLLFVRGKGHILYLDTNAVELGERRLRAPELSAVFVDGKDAGEMGRAERVIAEVAGPRHEIRVEPLSGEGEAAARSLKLPAAWTEIVISIPALLAGEADELVVTRFAAPPESAESEPNSFQQDESEVIPLAQ
ncbi:MAG TPA: hypothetical protein PLB91_09785 [Spirochaetales bacterium]|nr:hypothetical protein [Spirochaetales bacterium]HRY55887.1 hypothetical protein [Spirochaetia bacterium]HRZ63485.1 hypothetical protein [Spirochaetia bacterium]